MFNLIKNSKINSHNIRKISNVSRKYKYFDNIKIKNNIAVIPINGPEKINVINQEMFNEAKHIFHQNILNNPIIKGVVFISQKKDNFIAGADINMISNAKNKEELKQITLEGKQFFDKIKKTKIPLISAINGSCMGGGLEWALYCDYRIISNDKKTVLSLPEVKLGLLPGMAGTYHLPKLIGLPNSLDMMLTGKNIRPDKAKQIGLVNEVVDKDDLERLAILRAKKIVSNKLKIRKRKLNYMDYLEKNGLVRKYIFNQAKKGVDKATGGKMPAPYMIIKTVKENYGKNKNEYLNNESHNFAELSETDASKALIGLFNGSNLVKKHNYGNPEKIKNITVIGGGLMGTGISQVSLDNGKYNVCLKDTGEDNVLKSGNVISRELENKVKRKHLSKNEFNTLKNNLSLVHTNSQEIKKSDLIIEAVFEDLDLKHKIISEMEKVTNDNTIFASNTSAIPISSIAKGSNRPQQVIGMHYFSPVPKMPLLEIIPHKDTCPKVIATAFEVGSKQGKIPILVKDVPGFYVNRCLAPLIVEFPKLILEGVKLETVEKAMKGYGMPVGPLTLSDEVGIDVSKHVGDFMSNADLGVRMNGDLSIMNDMYKKGWLGRKSGKGFYTYSGKKKHLNSELLDYLKERNINYGSNNMSVEDIQMRLLGRFINEAAFCLQDEIIRSPVDGDIGAVFGIGFPPHLGGPFRMLDLTGTQQFIDKMSRFSEDHGEHFEPPQILKDYGKSRRKFY